MLETIHEVTRWANAGIATVAAAFVIATLRERWEQITPRLRMIGGWLAFLLLVVAYGSGESAAQGAPIGARVVLMLVALTGLAGALVYRRSDPL